jgi:hypothetical protein
VSLQDWSKYVPKTPKLPDTCRLPVLPRVLYGPCHVIVRTCHVIVRTCHVSSPGAATSPVRTLPRQLYGLARVCTDCTDRYSQQSQNFACLARRTECDIFLIRTPFAIKIIPPESGRRAGRHGVGFVGFRALSFLSIFHALMAPGSDF